jgi:hypothetical protein
VNNLLYQQLDELLGNAPDRSDLKFEGALRVGAATLYRADCSEITATTVVCDVGRDDIEAFRLQAAAIAEEYGFESSIRESDGSYSVRFTRRGR